MAQAFRPRAGRSRRTAARRGWTRRHRRGRRTERIAFSCSQADSRVAVLGVDASVSAKLRYSRPLFHGSQCLHERERIGRALGGHLRRGRDRSGEHHELSVDHRQAHQHVGPAVRTRRRAGEARPAAARRTCRGPTCDKNASIASSGSSASIAELEVNGVGPSGSMWSRTQRLDRHPAEGVDLRARARAAAPGSRPRSRRRPGRRRRSPRSGDRATISGISGSGGRLRMRNDVVTSSGASTAHCGPAPQHRVGVARGPRSACPRTPC